MKVIDLFSYKNKEFEPFKEISLEVFKNSDSIILGHFTSSKFLEGICQHGICPPTKTKMFSNKDNLFSDGDEKYIYLSSHFDSFFSENAVKKHGGDEILILVKISPLDLELDNIRNRHIDQGLQLNNLEKIFEELQNPWAAQARTKTTIFPKNILKVIDLKTMNEIKTA